MDGPEAIHPNKEMDMKQIPLTQGKVALVDDSDFDFINQWKWQAAKNGKNFYAVRSVRTPLGKKTIKMHREITNAPAGMQIDHINHNGLDNRRSNLRVCTHTENRWNTEFAPTKIGFKGVCWDEKRKRYTVHLVQRGKRVYVGRFKDAVEAARAYDAAAKRLRGQFAVLNFPE